MAPTEERAGGREGGGRREEGVERRTDRRIRREGSEEARAYKEDRDSINMVQMK